MEKIFHKKNLIIVNKFGILFECQTLNDFGRVYIWCDVFHLADVWTHYNDFSVKQFHLDLGRFVTLPNVAWDSWMHFRDLTGDNIEIKTVNNL